MRILNEEYKVEMNKYNKKYNLGLSNEECIEYSNCFYTICEITKNQLTFEQIFLTYYFFVDVLEGNRPDIDMFSSDDAYKGFYRLSKRYSTTKNLLEDERKLLCFAIYLATCVCEIDEYSKRINSNMKVFEQGAKYIIDEYNYELKQFPNKFEIKVYSNYEKEDYGLTINNPIEVTSIEKEYEYLSVIETENGKPIMFTRKGSYDLEDVFVDEYEIFIKIGLFKKKLTNLYLTGYGIDNSMHAPKGFRFIDYEK